MFLIRAAALASLAAAAPAAAADLFGSTPPMTFPASQSATVIENGTNWYVRGDLGIDFTSAPRIALGAVPSAPPGLLGAGAVSTGSTTGFVGGLGAGYRLSDFIRLDATWDYWTAPGRARSVAVVCPYGLSGVANPATGGGYLYDRSNACLGSLNLSPHNNTFLANAYVDLGTYAGFTPYVGAGLGLDASALQGSANFVEAANGLPYAANLASNGQFPSVWVNSAGQPIVPQPAVPFALQVWNRSLHSVSYHFAWALTAGVGFQLTPSATLDLGYRYLNGGETTLLVNPQTGLSIRQSNVSQQILVGVRYVLQ
jgi:opacity protein-like surface antigen